jgi:hypothetical protein
MSLSHINYFKYMKFISEIVEAELLFKKAIEKA